ncbi:NUDIX domain-containing protein [Alicyclobacillus sp. SO9]|uniref:NUDIX domain-containing protein n=1 Tax=Alicyclobacillus sp. SO9 TaxID=2665646 RepID=UPI0018E6E227|nr:NUDIX domain-containing protein [Alicyclobacillus sp. SO9]QQE80382.1 NUDIX domain-containing protein [Alicyclobacillus sp. SO9]
MSYWKEVTEIHRNQETARNPQSVLVFAFTKAGQLLWVLHPIRGWEVPGGKIEPSETPVEAVQREVWEEAGAELENLHWMAEYEIQLAPSVQSCKWVYFADVVSVSSRPSTSEILDVRMGPPLSPEDILANKTYSPVVKDTVYRSLWPDVLHKSRSIQKGSP